MLYVCRGRRYWLLLCGPIPAKQGIANVHIHNARTPFTLPPRQYILLGHLTIGEKSRLHSSTPVAWSCEAIEIADYSGLPYRTWERLSPLAKSRLPIFSSHFSRTAITDLHLNQCDDHFDIAPYCTIMQNRARLQRRHVRNHCPGSLKTEPNDTQGKRRGTTLAVSGSCQPSAPFLHFCNLTSDLCNPAKSNLLNTLLVTYLLSST